MQSSQLARIPIGGATGVSPVRRAALWLAAHPIPRPASLKPNHSDVTRITALGRQTGKIAKKCIGGSVFKIVHAQFIALGSSASRLRRRGSRASSGGQFVILRICENGERIPLTIEKSDPEHGTVNIVVQSIGKTTNLLNSLETGTAFSTSSGLWASLRRLRATARWWRSGAAWERQWRIRRQRR